MKTLILFFTSISIIAAAPNKFGEHLEILKKSNGDVFDTTVREKKSLIQTDFDHPLSDSTDEGLPSGRNIYVKKPIVVKKKFGHRVFRNSDEETELASSREKCNEKVKLKLCDEKATSKAVDMEGLTMTEDADDHVMSEEDMKQSLKMAKEAIANLERDLQKMDGKSNMKWEQDEKNAETDAKIQKDIDATKEVLEQIHHNFGNLQSMSLHASKSDNSDSTHNVHLTIAKTEEERIAQWKEAMENIQRNIEIARNIEDSFKMESDDSSIDESTFLEDINSENLDENEQLTEKRSMNNHDMSLAASEVDPSIVNFDKQNEHESLLKSAADSSLTDKSLTKELNSNHHNLAKSSESDILKNLHYHDEDSETGNSKLSKHADEKLENMDTVNTDVKLVHENSNWDTMPSMKSQMKSSEFSKLTLEEDKKSSHNKKEDEKNNDSHHLRESLDDDDNLKTHVTDQKSASTMKNAETIKERQFKPNMVNEEGSVQIQNNHNKHSSMKSANIENMPKLKEPTQKLFDTDSNNKDIMKTGNTKSKNHGEMSTAQTKFEETNNFRSANEMQPAHQMHVMTDVNPIDTDRAHMHMRQMHGHFRDGLVHGQVFHGDHIDTALHSNMRDNLHDLRPNNAMFRWKPNQERVAYGPPISAQSGSNAVGVFPNANVGSCGIPLLLSCSPSVVSGSLAKAIPSGYTAPAYRMEEDFSLMPNKREINKAKEFLSADFKTMTSDTKMNKF